MIDAVDGNKVYFYHFDQVGTTLALTNTNGEVTDAYVYDPYGRLLRHDGDNPQPFTFAGAWGVRQEGDSGSLYQMRARYYDAAIGRFLTPEPLWPRLAEPEALNPYQYAFNVPVSHVDVTGLAPAPVLNALDLMLLKIGDEEYALDNKITGHDLSVEALNAAIDLGIDFNNKHLDWVRELLRDNIDDLRKRHQPLKDFLGRREVQRKLALAVKKRRLIRRLEWEAAVAKKEAEDDRLHAEWDRRNAERNLQLQGKLAELQHLGPHVAQNAARLIEAKNFAEARALLRLDDIAATKEEIRDLQRYLHLP